jgi:hypothetical protein
MLIALTLINEFDYVTEYLASAFVGVFVTLEMNKIMSHLHLESRSIGCSGTHIQVAATLCSPF